jgi:DNA-binding NarL/FixJ family response regulator
MSTSRTHSNLRPIKPAPSTVRVLLVDDHPAVRLGLRNLIDDQPDMTVVAEAASVRQALAELDTPADVAIVDYDLGPGRDGLDLATRLSRLERPPRILIYSASADSTLAVTAILAGADGLLAKDASGDVLCMAIRRLARGLHYFPAVSAPLARAMASRLNQRDQAIFGMLLHGIQPEEIAKQLGLAPDQIHASRAEILRGVKRAPARRITGSRAPLDYERPLRRASRWAA